MIVSRYHILLLFSSSSCDLARVIYLFNVTVMNIAHSEMDNTHLVYNECIWGSVVNQYIHILPSVSKVHFDWLMQCQEQSNHCKELKENKIGWKSPCYQVRNYLEFIYLFFFFHIFCFLKNKLSNINNIEQLKTIFIRTQLNNHNKNVE